MERHHPEQQGAFIRITSEEANSSHVDDLLNRQMSLLGESGISRTGRHWYYQNWFVFGLVATVAAFAAWAIIEPYFDDLLYVQGKLDQMDLSAPKTFPSVDLRGRQVEITSRGYLQIRDQKAWLLDGTSMLQRGDAEPFNALRLEPGRETGIYAEYARAGNEAVAFAVFVDPAPEQPPPTKALLSFRQLAARTQGAGLVLFALVGGFIGLAIGAADGIVCRVPRRALICGAVGFVVGFIGGFMSNIFSNLIYHPISQLAMRQDGGSVGSLSTLGFLLQMGGRSLAWGLAGTTMGLGQGIALRSKRLFVYGLIGGVAGGLIGGLFFDPVDMILLGGLKPSAHVSRLVGIVVVGLCVGGMIGVVELLARDSWLRMTSGPLAGKEFLIFKDVMNIGSSPRSEIYLFNDPAVAEVHATIRGVADGCEIENRSQYPPTVLNGRPFKRAKLRPGDEIRIGRTAFIYEKRQG
jgi:hypothetical protein